MAPIEQILVPSAMLPFLAYIFDKIKPWLGKLAPFSQSNGNHAVNLRALFFVICAAAVLVFALATGLMPHDFDAGVMLIERVLVTAGFMTTGAHLVYDQLSGNAAVRREERKPVYAPVDGKVNPIYPPNYDAGGDLRASAGVSDAPTADAPAS